MTRRLRIDDLTALAVPGQPAVSPDGGQVVYVLRTSDVDADRNCFALWQVGTRTGEPRRLTHGTTDTDPAWSPDGTQLGFLREHEGVAQVWLLPTTGGEALMLTSLPLGAGRPRWSPDGTRIAFAGPVDLAAAVGEPAEARTRRATGPIVAERLDYQADGTGLLRTVRSHLHVVDVATGECRQVTEGDWHAGEPAWSPDSTRLAFAAATEPDAHVAPPVPVHVVDVSGGFRPPRLVGLAAGAGGAVTWTADGSALLVVGRPDQRIGNQRLLRIPLAGGEPVDLAASLDRNVLQGGPDSPGPPPRLVDGGATVLFSVRDRGHSHLYTVPVAGGPPTPVLTGPDRVVTGASAAGDTVVVTLTTPTSFGEVVTLDLAGGAETTRTGHGAHPADVELFTRAEREFTVSDGTVVHGWLARDPDAAGPGPLLLDVHGGPDDAWHGAADAVHGYHQELVALGWTVLLLNPRGSDGYGEEFLRGVLAGWGVADANDFLEPIDQLVAEGIADPNRLAVTGYSYGGYTTCYLTSRDTRFAAAVGGGVVADLTSMAGTSDLGHFLAADELGAMPWTDRDRYAVSSPFARVDRVRTPTLLLHGLADRRCPVGQSQQWHMALRERGVPTRLVLYPDASHEFIVDGPPSQRIDFNRRVLDWLERYAGAATGPRPAALDAEHWGPRLADLASRHHVPGAALGLLRLRPGRADELVETAYGVLNKNTGVPVTTDSLFQLGSITKIWTTTLVMQLVEEGRLDLDAPVVDVLPELRLADPDVTKQVTVRHLLTHTSGIDGDVFVDTGRGDDAVARYVALLADVPQTHPLGATLSYCNSGFSLAGRMVEQLTGGTWDEALRERLVKPLGLRHTVTLPEEALLHRAAVGHDGEPGGERDRVAVWGLPRGVGPAGLVTSTVADLLAFARAHLAGGVAADGTRVLGAAGVAEMARQHAELPHAHHIADSWGLGWMRFDWSGHRLIGHDGSTIGQSTFLRLLPEQGLAVALLTNGGDADELHQDLFREIFAEVAGITPPEPPEPPAEPVPVPVDMADLVGTYERTGVRMEVSDGEDGPTVRITQTGPLAGLSPDPVTELKLVPLADNVFLTREPGQRSWRPLVFYRLPTGERYVHRNTRATPKVS